MRWPFGPPHLTLKPSNKKTPPKKKTNKNKINKKKEKKEAPPKKKQKTPKNSFSVISQIFPFFLVKNRGFRAFFFQKQLCVTRRPFFGPKNPKFINFSYHFFCLFSSLSKTKKNTKICWNPYFYSVLADLKKENFQKNNLKHWKLKKNNFCTPFLKKAIFR